MAAFPRARHDIAARPEGAVAQLGERLVRNEEVRGSIPLGSTSLRPCGASAGRPAFATRSAIARDFKGRRLPAVARRAKAGYDCRKLRPSSPPLNEARTFASVAPPPAGPRRMGDDPASILRHGPLARFWLARVATSVAFQMQAVAVGWQLYDLTSNPVDLGLVGLIQFIPVLLLILITRQIVDRHDRPILLALAQAVR